MLRSKDDLELENDEKIASNQPISNDHETLKENIPYSETVQEQTSTDVELLKKFIVKNPGGISHQFVWKRQLLNPRKVPKISGKNKKNRQNNVVPEADIAKLNFPYFLKRVIFCSDFFVSKFLGN